ncbi:hypothetical protein A3W37_23045 [Salmonella enterica subsp. enterica serovar Enteritidis]|nr:hypothetical protein [Salmonella enterica subsp. enterica serovar Enteritidis]
MDYQTRLNSDITKEIDYLASLRKQRMVADLRTELVYGTLVRLADMICNTVTDWSLPCPVLPLSSVQQWHKAREIVLADYEDFGHAAWDYARHYMKTELSFGYACYKNDIA